MEVKSADRAAADEAAGIPFDLDEETLAIQARARRFTEDVLIPLEEQSESLGGKLPDDVIEEVKREALAAGLAGPLHARERGGQGFTRMQWALVEEQYGRSTNAIHWHIPNGYNVWEHAATPIRSAGSSRSCAARSATPTRSPSAARGPTPPGSRRPRTAPTAASGSTARSGSSPPATSAR